MIQWMCRVPLSAVCLLAAGAQLVARIPLLSTRRFDPDEFEHAHVAWSILQGAVPYRDFFEHHTPIFHYLAAFLIFSFDPGESADNAMHALVSVRWAAWALSVGIVVATFVLARRLRDTTTAWMSLPIVAGSIVMALRAIEIRPDGLSTLLWLVSLGLFHAGLNRTAPLAGRTHALFGMSGLSIGLGVLTSQKLLLAGPSFTALLAWYVVGARFAGTRRDRMRNAGWQVAGVLVPWAMAAAFFAFHGALDPFVRRTLLENLAWQSETSATTVIMFIMRQEPWLFALVAGGVVLLASEARRRDSRAVSATVLLAGAAGTFLGLFLVPVPYLQYCLTFIPLFAILAAVCLVELSRRLAARPRALAFRISPVTWTAGGAIVALAVIGHVEARPVLVSPFVYPAIVAVTAAAVLTLPFCRRPELALAAAVVLLSVIPAQRTRWMYELGDQGQFSELRFVMEHSTPDAMVFDGWTGYGVFRRHATYYWMLHPGVRAMLSADEVDAIAEGVASGRVAPDVVVLDRNVRALSARLAEFVEANYRRTDVGDIMLRAAP